MADEYTPNLGLTKPDVGYSDDTWGEKLNINFDKIDAAISTAVTIPPEYITETELPELIDDRVAALLQAGANVTITYDDAGNKITIASSGGGSGGGVSVTMSVDPPASPVAGNLWFESDTGLLYIYYVDPTPNSYWVALTTLSSGGGITQADADLRYVNVTGDRMTGRLTFDDNFGLAWDDQNTALMGNAAAHNITLYTGGAARAIINDSGVMTITSPPQADKSSLVPNTSWVKQWAAPFDAMAYSGMQYNGSMEVSQEKAGAESTGGFVVDGWRLDQIGSGVMGASQLGGFSGFTNRLGIRVITAQPTMLAGDVFIFSHLIEGYKLSRLGWGTANAQPLTIGFWTAHIKTGIYTVSFRNLALTRAYAGTYTQNVSGAWEYKTITVPGETTGVWQATNGVGVYMAFVLASGASNFTSAANAWVTAGIAAPGQVNALDSVSNAFNITGVVVLPGSEAPSATRSPLIMRPYEQELLACKRYWQCSNPASPKGGGIGLIAGIANITTGVYGSWKWDVSMCKTPTFTVWLNSVQNQCRNDQSGATVTLASPTMIITPERGYLMQNTNAVFVLSNFYSFDLQLDARLV